MLLMSVEVLKLFVFEDYSDKILSREVITGGEGRIIDYLDHSDIMVLLSKNEVNTGILIKSPERVTVDLFYSSGDMVGVSMNDKYVVPLKPGQELCIWNEFSRKEIWLTHNASDGVVKIPLEMSPASVFE